MTRTDVHAPSSQDFDPEAYECVGVFDMQPEWPNPEASAYRIRLINEYLDKGYRFGHGGSTQCGHCGARIRYAALMVREDVKQFIYVGETCLDNRFEMTKGEFQALRKTASLNRERMARKDKVDALFATYPSLVWGSYLHNLEVAGGRDVIVGEDGEEAEGVTMEQVRADQDYRWFIRNDGGFITKTRTGWEFSTLGDIYGKALRYGDLSEKQAAFFDSLLTKLDTKANWLAEREAKTAALVAAGVEVPEGRLVIEGTVLSTKWVDNDFGGSLKMLVQHADGWKVWGTVPSSIDANKGDVVRFTAAVTRSNDDSLFGFYKRPTKAEVLKVAEVTDAA